MTKICPVYMKSAAVQILSLVRASVCSCSLCSKRTDLSELQLKIYFFMQKCLPHKDNQYNGKLSVNYVFSVQFVVFLCLAHPLIELFQKTIYNERYRYLKSSKSAEWMETPF